MNGESPDCHSNGRTVLVLSNDLFFSMRIRDALRQLGYHPLIASSEAEFSSAASNAESLVLGLIDFNHQLEWDALAPTLTGTGFPTVAFGPHKDTTGFAAARNAGVTRVVSNGTFTSSLPDLVQKYAESGPS